MSRKRPYRKTLDEPPAAACTTGSLARPEGEPPQDKHSPDGRSTDPGTDSASKASKAKPKAGSKKKAAAAAKERTVCTKVSDLSPMMKDLVNELLVHGATFEDVVDSIHEQSDEFEVTLQAVQNWFRHDLQLQAQRIRQQVEAFEQLKAQLGNPETAEGRVAEAVFFTGFMGLHRKSADIPARQAEWARSQRERDKLQERYMRERLRSIEKLNRKSEAQIRYLNAMTAKMRELMAKVRHDNEAARAQGAKAITPQTLHAIREIYGLLPDPIVPVELQLNGPPPEGSPGSEPELPVLDFEEGDHALEQK